MRDQTISAKAERERPPNALACYNHQQLLGFLVSLASVSARKAEAVRTKRPVLRQTAPKRPCPGIRAKTP